MSPLFLLTIYVKLIRLEKVCFKLCCIKINLVVFLQLIVEHLTSSHENPQRNPGEKKFRSNAQLFVLY